MTKVGNNLFVSMADLTFGAYLYMYDGATLTQVSSTSGGTNDQPSIKGYIGGKLYFSAIDTFGNARTYRINPDGTGQTQLPTVFANPMSDNFDNFTLYNSKIYMTSYNLDLWPSMYLDLYSYDPVGNSFAHVKSLDGLKGDADTKSLLATSFGLFMRANRTIYGMPYKLGYLMDNSENFEYLRGELSGDSGTSGAWYAGGKLYLRKYDSELNMKLFEHNLDTGVETQMCDLAPGYDDEIQMLLNQDNTVSGVFSSSGHIYLSANWQAGGNKKKLIRCEGGVATQISNINVGGDDFIGKIITSGDTAYFTAVNAAGHKKLYEFSHVGGLIQRTNINVGGDDGIDDYDLVLDATKNKLYFSANPGLGRDRMYVYDTVTHLTTQISNIAPAASESDDQIKVVNHKLYWVAYNNLGFTKIYSYDPDAPVMVTTPLFSVFPGNTDIVNYFGVVGDKVYAWIWDPTYSGSNMYEYDINTTTLSANYIFNGTSYSNPGSAMVVGSSVYFNPVDNLGYGSVHRFSSTVRDQVFQSSTNGDDNITFMWSHLDALLSYSKDKDGYNRLHYTDGTNYGVVGKVNAADNDAVYMFLTVPNYGLIVLGQTSTPGAPDNAAWLWNKK